MKLEDTTIEMRPQTHEMREIVVVQRRRISEPREMRDDRNACNDDEKHERSQPVLYKV